MTYQSVDTIPSKLFFKILDTGQYQLLSDEIKDEKELKRIWDIIEQEDTELNPNDRTNDSIDVFKKVEWLAAKYKCIELCIRHLRYKKDDELIEKLREYGYKLRYDAGSLKDENWSAAEAIFQMDLDEIVRLSEDIGTQIERALVLLERKNKKTGKASSYDEVVMGYAAFTGSGFIDTNTITQSQYRALIKMGDEKIKSLEKSISKNGKRKN